MRAARVHVLGEPLSVDDVPEPVAEGSTTVVRLEHAAVNPLDLRVCSGALGELPLPFTPGLEGVGRTPDGAVVLVAGQGLGLRRPGTYAEQVAAPTGSLVPVPAKVDPAQAAGVGVAGLTAWGMVHRNAEVTRDDRVLVLGATGGVGMLALQLAREVGADVWAVVSSGDDVDRVRELGASEVVVAGGPDALAEALRPFRPTVALDPLGGGYTGAVVQAIEPRGRIVVVGVSAAAHTTLDLGAVYRKAVTIRGHALFSTSPDDVRRGLDHCLTAMAAGRLRVHVDAVMPLERVNEAHARLVQRRVTGKLVLSMAA